MTRSILAAVAVVLAAAIPSSAAALSDAQEPSLDSYIVVLKPDAARSDASARSARPLVSTVAQELSRAHSADVTAVYQYALKGFAARLSADQADALTNDPRVEYVEQDQVFHTLATQTPATWGLDRVDQRDLPLNNTYTYNQTGQGVQAYIIDTGMRATHQQFTGRVGNGFTAINDGNGTNDCNGHGTHVAGTVGGTTYGIAKQVTLHAVRVLDCSGSGSNAGVIAGVDWVTQNHGSPAVANMSLGGGVSSALDQAVANSISSGVSYAIAAGNSNANACNSSPARVPSANTVGATTNTDARSSFSNFGTCVDIFAPGSNITSSWNTNDTATNTISGTSMATPHVTGALALYLQTNPGASPTAATQALIDNSTPNKVTNPGTGSPNRLLFTALRRRISRRHHAADDVHHLAGQRRHREQHGHGRSQRERQRRRQPRGALRGRRPDRLGHDRAVPDRLEHDHRHERRSRAPDEGLRRRRQRGLEHGRERDREQCHGWRRPADRQRRLRGLRLAVDALGSRVLVDGG